MAKTIHDMANEKYPLLTGELATYNEKFVEGANYVLEQIEQLIYEKHVKGNLPLFDLTYLIDKLKEK